MYLSRTLNPHEKNYMVSEKELLVVLWSIEKLSPYVEGYHFTVVTDHSTLKWLKNLKDPTGRLGVGTSRSYIGKARSTNSLTPCRESTREVSWKRSKRYAMRGTCD